jgi:hypothetical protein
VSHTSRRRGAGRRQVGERSIHAHAIGDVFRRRSDAWCLVCRPIEIRHDRKSHGIGGDHECAFGWRDVTFRDSIHGHRAGGTGERTTSRVALRPLEVRQHIPEAPTGVAALGPAVVVKGGATEPDATVHRGRSTDQTRARERKWIVGFSPRQCEAPAVRVWPDVRGVQEFRRPGGGIGAVIWTGLQQQHTPTTVLGQPVGEDAPSRAGADEDGVVLQKLMLVHTTRIARLTSGERLSSLAGQRYEIASDAEFSATADQHHAQSGHERLA